jgi:rfaE bifunctional protein nucleotidyltransferase chain/domain
MKSIESIKNKITSLSALTELRGRLKKKGKTVVFTNGCFDILHRGHIEYLSGAAQLGDFFIIGLNSDSSVSRLKGKGRPLQDQDSRALILAALSFTDAIVLFDTDTPIGLITAIKPDILVKGGDYRPEDIVGYDVVTSGGGKVLVLPFVEGHSSSAVIKRLG